MRRSARRWRLSGARGGVAAARYIRSSRRVSISSAVGGGVRSSYKARASPFDTCRSAKPRTTTRCFRPNGRPISISSPARSRRSGFATWPLTESLPFLQALCASERVLNRHATSSQTSRRASFGASFAAGLARISGDIVPGRLDIIRLGRPECPRARASCPLPHSSP